MNTKFEGTSLVRLSYAAVTAAVVYAAASVMLPDTSVAPADPWAEFEDAPAVSTWRAVPKIDARWLGGAPRVDRWWRDGGAAEAQHAFSIGLDAANMCEGLLVLANASGLLTGEVSVEVKTMIAYVDADLWRPLPRDTKRDVSICLGAVFGSADLIRVTLVDAAGVSVGA